MFAQISKKIEFLCYYSASYKDWSGCQFVMSFQGSRRNKELGCIVWQMFNLLGLYIDCVNDLKIFTAIEEYYLSEKRKFILVAEF